MSRNFHRACNLIVSGAKGYKDLAALRVAFAIKQWHFQAPNMASFRVYNPAPATAAALKANEFTKVDFYAGYEDNNGLVFSGSIKQTISGHENPTDTYVDIFCADGEHGYNAARLGKTLSAGYTPQDKLNAAVDTLKPFGVTLGLNTLNLSKPKYPRGIPLIGMARDVIRDVVLSNGGIWSIQLGKIKITDKKLTGADGSTFEMNGKTGMIGWPQQTADGIYVRSLLNPQLQPLCKLKINPSSIIQAEQDNNPLSQSGPQTNQFLNQQNVASGIYTIFHMERRGDTWSPTDWFDESLCIGKGGNPPPSQLDQGYYVGTP